MPKIHFTHMFWCRPLHHLNENLTNTSYKNQSLLLSSPPLFFSHPQALKLCEVNPIWTLWQICGFSNSKYWLFPFFKEIVHRERKVDTDFWAQPSSVKVNTEVIHMFHTITASSWSNMCWNPVTETSWGLHSKSSWEREIACEGNEYSTYVYEWNTCAGKSSWWLF